MGWRSEDGTHAGWAATEFSGDRYAYGASGKPIGQGGGALVRYRDPDTGHWERRQEVVDGRAALGWRGLCECGWRGPLWTRADEPELADLDVRRLHLPEPSPYGIPPEGIEDAIRAEWQAHLHPTDALTEVRIHAAAMAAAQVRLADAVRAARRTGSSWADIGNAAAITRQSAHERWAHICT